MNRFLLLFAASTFLFATHHEAANAQADISKIANEADAAETAAEISAQESAEESTDPISTSKEPIPQIKRKREEVDLRFRPERRYIQHPFAEKGLIRIDKERVYYYRVKSSPIEGAAAVKIGTFDPTELANPDTGATFAELYPDSGPIIHYDHEWNYFNWPIGKIGYKLGSGLFFAQGNGRFENNPVETPSEEFTLFAFPVNVGIFYRAQFWDTQPIIPYAEGGVGGFAIIENRDDDEGPFFGFAPTAHFSVGGALRFGTGSRAFIELDREYGINTMYAVLEFRSYIGLSDSLDFTGNAISGGILLDY